MMSDNYPMDPNDLRQRGTKGVMSAVGGVGLMLIGGLVSSPILAGIIGGGLALLGLGGIFSKKRTDRSTGGLVLAVGGIAIASAFLHGPLSGLISLGGLALLGYGGWNIFKFVKGLKSRA
jgi:hypothetical protein